MRLAEERRVQMRPVSVMLTVTWMTVVLASTGSAQFLYLDANGDGRNDRTDRLATAESTRVDIWLQTDKNADGSPALCRGPVDQPFTINSYEFILRSVGGTVEWGTYTNLQPRMRFHHLECPGRESTDSAGVVEFPLGAGPHVFRVVLCR